MVTYTPESIALLRHYNTMAAIETIAGAFDAKASRHESVSVCVWQKTILYIQVTNHRLPYPESHRALVSFDAAQGLLKLAGEAGQYSFVRRGWRRFVSALIGNRVPAYSDEPGNRLVPGRPYKHVGHHVSNMINDYGIAGSWSVAASASRYLAGDDGLTAFFATEEDAITAYQTHINPLVVAPGM